MVSSDKEHVSALFALVVDLLDSLIGLRACLNSRFVHTSVADHIWWRKVVHQKLELAGLDPFTQLLRDSHGAHCRLQVIRGDLRGGNHFALLVLKLLLNAAIEEESNVCVFLGLSDVALLHSLFAQCFGEHVGHTLGFEGDVEGVFRIVRRHSSKVGVLWVGEIGLGGTVDIAQELGDLANTVRTVVEEEYCVIVCTSQLMDTKVLMAHSALRKELTLYSSFLPIYNDGLQELIILVLAVSLLDSSHRVTAFLAFSFDQAVQANLDSVPPLIAVHDVVSAHHGRDVAEADLLGGLQQSLHVSGGRLGICVTAVAKEVDVGLGHALSLGDLEEGYQMVHVRVHAAVGHEAAEVESAIAIDGALEGLLDGGDVLELVVLDGLRNADGILPDDPAGANVQVADLAVAHEAFREADGERRCLELGIALGSLGSVLGEVVHGRRVGCEDGIAIFARLFCCDSPAVDDDQDGLLVDLGHGGRPNCDGEGEGDGEVCLGGVHSGGTDRKGRRARKTRWW